MDPTTHETQTTQETQSEAFQKKVANRFHDLSSAAAAANSDDFLSIPWLRKLLDAFISCQDDFSAIISNNRVHFDKPPMDRHMSDFYERSIKALDVCNAARDGIDQIRQWQKHLEIVMRALSNNNRSIGEGQIRRAKRALTDLSISMLDEKDSSSSHSALASYRNRSFGNNVNNNNSSIGVHYQKNLGHFRSLSWSVSRSWSAAKQLQAIGSNLMAPKANETASTNGLNLVVFTMNYVLLFVMWVLVAAIPCQDRGLQTHFTATKQFLWSGPILSIHERILEESRRRDRRNLCGLLREIHEIGKCARGLSELTDSIKFPMVEEKEREVRESVVEVGIVCEGLRDGLFPLERRVRDVFHGIVRGRTEGFDSIKSME